MTAIRDPRASADPVTISVSERNRIGAELHVDSAIDAINASSSVARRTSDLQLS
jgi:hypothetical protein